MDEPLVSLPASTSKAQNLIANSWSSAGNSSPLLSPYTGTQIGNLLAATPQEILRAVAAAHDATTPWAATPLKERSKPLYRFRQLMLDALPRLANTAAAESGKIVTEAEAGILKGLEVVEFALSLQNMLGGGKVEVSRGVTCESSRSPLGVVAGITPFNFPAMVPLWMFPIAVTLGNCFILKPSEKVPLTATLLGELMVESGYPVGVFSILHGGRDVVEALADHDAVQALAFVGSTPVAQSLYQRATMRGIRALCLGGAKNHLIVVPDADPGITVPGIVSSFTGCAGQRCMAGSVLVAVGEVDAIVQKVVEAAAAMPLGRGIGALIDCAARDRLHAAIAKAESEGARILLDGRLAAAPSGYEGGNWLAPTILDGVRPTMQCSCEELFGPILSIIRVDTLEEALGLDAASPFGNATSIFTTSGAVGKYVADRSGSGMIGINIGVPVPREPFSFGGTKSSKFGACDITGESAVEFWSTIKKVTAKWAPQADTTWMG